MRLHDTHAGSFPVAAALNGKKVSLLKLFTHSLSYLKEDAMAEINRSQVNVLRPNEIKWVLTGMSFHCCPSRKTCYTKYFLHICVPLGLELIISCADPLLPLFHFSAY